jgi:transcriptional regulator with XRE-family HTH domain
MKTVGERIKEVRKALGLSGEAFGKPIGLSRGALSNIERNTNGASDRTIRLICSKYCVDYFWLTEGKGEMFIDDMDAILEELAAEKGYDVDTLRIMKKLYSLPNDQFNLVMQLIDNLVEKKDE